MDINEFDKAMKDMVCEFPEDIPNDTEYSNRNYISMSIFDRLRKEIESEKQAERYKRIRKEIEEYYIELKKKGIYEEARWKGIITFLINLYLLDSINWGKVVNWEQVQTAIGYMGGSYKLEWIEYEDILNEEL